MGHLGESIGERHYFGEYLEPGETEAFLKVDFSYQIDLSEMMVS